jgi:hypothetical protein
MKSNKRTFCIAIGTAAAVLLCAAAASAAWGSRSAQQRQRAREVVWYQYAAQFTCGQNFDGADRAVPATYATAINIHNPHRTEVIIRKHVALTYPPEVQLPGQVSAGILENIDRLAALQVDCGEILSDEFEFADPPTTDYVQGFLVIESRVPIDVAATYTATGEDDEVSVDAEKIAERKMTRVAVDEKLEICHVPPGNPDNEHEIEIDESSWPAHREHGDRLGDCDEPVVDPRGDD